MNASQIRHDLAVAYAQAKLSSALTDPAFSCLADENVTAAKFLPVWYKEIYTELSKLPDSDFEP